MSQYELTFLLNNEEEIKKMKDLLQTVKGKLVKEEAWGKKTLCYPIKKQKTAQFYHWIIEINQNKVQDLRKKLNFNENLLRFLLLKISTKGRQS